MGTKTETFGNGFNGSSMIETGYKVPICPGKKYTLCVTLLNKQPYHFCPYFHPPYITYITT